MTPEEYDAELTALMIQAAQGDDVSGKVKVLMAAFVLGMAAWLARRIPEEWAAGAAIVHGPLPPNHAEMAQLLVKLEVERFERVADVAVRKAQQIESRAKMLRLIPDGGRSWRAYARALEAEMRAKGATVFVDSMGREWSLKRYTEMVGRTVTANVRNEATKLRLIENGHDLARIGGPVPGERPACAHYAGMTVSLTGATPGYPTLDDYTSAGGFGPNCRHSLVMAM